MRDPHCLAYDLSKAQRLCLIEHAKGPQSCIAGSTRTEYGLIKLRLLCRNRSDAASRTARPRELRLTDPLGREVACIVMAQMIETMINAGSLVAAHVMQTFDAPDPEADPPLRTADEPDDDIWANNMVAKDRKATDALLVLLKNNFKSPISV